MIPDSDLVVFAVKPQDLPVAMGQLHHRLAKDQSALSIVAGAKMSTLTKGLGHASIIRVMPNTPAQIGCGMSLWTCSDEVDQTQRDLTQAMLGTVGVELYVAEENYLDMAAARSASGTGYLSLSIAALISARVPVVLLRDIAGTPALPPGVGRS